MIKLSTIKKTAINWYGNDPFGRSAAISYYTIFSFPALAFIYLSLASLFTGKESVQMQVSNYLTGIVGSKNALELQSIIENTAPQHTNIWAILVGAGILLFAALKLFLQLQETLNIIWRVKISERVNIWSLVKQRVVAFGVMLGILFIMLVTLFITTLITALGDFVTGYFSESLLIFISAFNFLLSFIIISFLFTILLKLLPDAEVGTRYAAIGGAFTAAMFILGQYLIGLYFDIAEPASAYGVTASIILLMLWVSYTCLILLLGAEFTKVIQEENNGEDAKATKLGAKKYKRK